MNERLIELAAQARIELFEDKSFGWSVIAGTDQHLAKFAELIVQECAELCDRFQARGVGMQPAECAGAIRKMFGVEQ